MVWLVIGAELFRGIVCDGIWISKGYDKMSYGIFILIHAVIIITGINFLAKARKV